ncbi:MAG: VWA domain-containing protein [Gammaproteobacteria bacterium]|nr:VWA domain-containing protein [Gammaproteobacteria bacterium]MDH3534171.1 VWA domain-containing protein [Gammaproteobacteria bacterium]
MGFSWISPLYLFGSLLLALPVLIHLVQRHRSSGVKFPSLMFLERIELRQKQRYEIRNWLLLLLRCLLLLLIVIAFARPFLLDAADGQLLDPGRKDSVIVIDRSYSMRVADHWQQARAAALAAVGEKNAGDRIGIVAFDDQAEVHSDLTASSADLRSIIERLSPGMRSTRLRLAIEQAARLLDGSNASRRQILVISDFQASAVVAGEVPALAPGIELTPLPIDAAEIANTTVSSLSLAPSLRGAADAITLNVELTSHASEAVDQSLSLVVNGRELERRDLRLQPGAVVVESFDEVSVSGALMRGVVSLDDDALALDNRAYFVYSSKRKLPVLLIEAEQPRNNQAVYAERALGLSQNPLFAVRRAPWSDLQARDLAAYAVIIVNDVALPGGALGDSLRGYVAAGGGLLVAAGANLQGNWPSGKQGFVPGTLMRQIDANPGMAQRIMGLDDRHPLASVLGAKAKIDLSLARVFSYRDLQPADDDRLLARYSDGGVALLERRVGRGRVLVLTTTLDAHWNDLALQPVFLPFLHQTMRYLAAFTSYPDSVPIGSVVDVLHYARALAGSDAVVAAAANPVLIIESPGAAQTRLERQSPLLAIAEPGFYQVHRATPAEIEVVLAANVDPAEAGLERLDLARFVEEIRASAKSLPADQVLTLRQAAEQEQRQQLWYWILCLVLVLILVEGFTANRIATRRPPGNRVKT